MRRVLAVEHERLLTFMTAQTFETEIDLAHAAVAFVVHAYQGMARIPATMRARIARDYFDICYDVLWKVSEAIHAEMVRRAARAPGSMSCNSPPASPLWLQSRSHCFCEILLSFASLAPAHDGRHIPWRATARAGPSRGVNQGARVEGAAKTEPSAWHEATPAPDSECAFHEPSPRPQSRSRRPGLEN